MISPEPWRVIPSNGLRRLTKEELRLNDMERRIDRLEDLLKITALFLIASIPVVAGFILGVLP